MIMNLDEIKATLKSTQISAAQIDPFGYCNAKCWFCPVRYESNPDSGKKQMPPELLEKILSNLVSERSGLVSPAFAYFYTAHYNEVLLYKYFEELCQLAVKYNLHHMILSNGTTLTKDRVDTILKYSTNVAGICLNIPSFRRSEWSAFTGFHEDKFDMLVENINYAIATLKPLVETKRISIQINGVNTDFVNYVGSLGPDAPPFDLTDTGTLFQNKAIGEKLFPTLPVYTQPSLVDRAGLMPLNVLTNTKLINRMKENKTRVTGCTNGMGDKGRPFSWLHVNATGKVFLCCNDYSMTHEIGDLSTQTLRDFWGTDAHAELIDRAFNDICTKCSSAKWD
jgi:hypothetical protein